MNSIRWSYLTVFTVHSLGFEVHHDQCGSSDDAGCLILRLDEIYWEPWRPYPPRSASAGGCCSLYRDYTPTLDSFHGMHDIYAHKGDAGVTQPSR